MPGPKLRWNHETTIRPVIASAWGGSAKGAMNRALAVFDAGNRPASGALFEGLVGAQGGSGVDLTRAADP